jgi:hypothetical protein
MISSVLYIGTGLDVGVTKYFSEVEKFVFIDTLPRSEFDRPNYYEPLFYSDNFYPKLVQNFKSNGFYIFDTKILDPNYHNKIFNFKQWILHKVFRFRLPNFINPTVLHLRNDKTNQIVKYYISTNIQTNMCKELEKDIRETDALIVSGYHPNTKVFDFFDIPKKFYGAVSTYFGNDEEDESDKNNIISYMYKNENLVSKYISEYYLIDFEILMNYGQFGNIKELHEKSKNIRQNQEDNIDVSN